MTTFKEDKDFYMIIHDDSTIRTYRKDNPDELNKLIKVMIEEVKKADTKQEQWFKSYWEMKQKVNRVKDVVSDDET